MGPSFLEALPIAAQSPLAMLGYLAVTGASFVIAYRVRRNKNLLHRIEAIPKNDRKELVQSEMGVVVPPKVSAEQWLRSKVHLYYFVGFVVLCLCLTLIAIIALTYSDDDGPVPGPDPSNEVIGNADEIANEAIPAAETENAIENGSITPASEGVGPAERIFSPAMLDERTIDLCIAPSAQYESIAQQCSAGATRLIAREFCRRNGYSAAVTWTGENTGIFQTSYKLRSAPDADGNVQNEFIPFDEGGSIFTSITCR